MPTLPTIISGLGLATDLYDYTIIGTLLPVLESKFGSMSASTKGLISMATCCGAICGQLCFGRLGDMIGRRSAFLSTALLTIVGSVGCTCVHLSATWHPYHQLMLWRFVLGVGIGGEYPLSAANTAENASAKSSGTQIAMAALCMLLGQLLAPLVVLVAKSACGDSTNDSMIFRVGFAFGVVLGMTSFSLRWSRMRETSKFQDFSNQRSDRRSMQVSLISELWLLKRPLLGTTLHWFIYDVISYGTGLYTTTIFEATTLTETMVNVLLVTLLSAPGYFLTLKIEIVGRRNAQLLGFGGMAICFVIIVVTAPAQWLFILVFGLQKSFDAFGPGFTTYLIPAEIFPTRLRASTHGLSAACGKLGAAVGIYVFPNLVHAVGVNSVLLGCGVLSFLACVTTLLLTPAYGPAELEVLDQAQGENISVILFQGTGRMNEVNEEVLVSLADVS